jgi:hypothetical protein
MLVQIYAVHHQDMSDYMGLEHRIQEKIMVILLHTTTPMRI